MFETQRTNERKIFDPDCYRTIFDSNLVGMLLASSDGTVIDANEETCRLLECDRDEILNASLTDIFDLLDDYSLPAIYEGCPIDNFKGIAHIRFQSATFVRAEVSIVRRSDKNNSELGIVFRLLDEEVTTPMLQSEKIPEYSQLQSLQINEQKFRITFDSVTIGMSHVAPDGRWLRVNDKLCEMTGFSREELLQLSFQDITHPADLDADLEQARRILEGRISSYSLEKRYVRKDGCRIWVNLTVSSIRQPSGKLDGFIAMIEDITPRKHKELIPRSFSWQENEALRLLALGKKNRDIAQSLNYSVSTIKFYVHRVFSKLGVDNRFSAVEEAVEIGLIPPPQWSTPYNVRNSNAASSRRDL